MESSSVGQKAYRAGLKDNGGIALVMVLWVLVLLTTIVTEFCWTMRIEANVARNFRDAEEAYYLAQAGFNRAIVELLKTQRGVREFTSKKTLVKEDREEGKGEKVEDVEEEGPEEWKPREIPYVLDLGTGLCEVTIEDEGSKWDLNWIAEKKNVAKLKDLVAKVTALEEEELDTVVDSIVDWRDRDHNHGLHGAEDEYYESLESPYECRDGPFVIPDELLLVKGISEEIYYGPHRGPGGRALNPQGIDRKEKEEREEEEDGERQPMGGLSELFTTFIETGDSRFGRGRININSAPPSLLMSVPGMTEEIADRIVEMRREEEFESPSDPRLITEIPDRSILARFEYGSATYCRLYATGTIPESGVRRTITAVVKVDYRNTRLKDRYKILYWKEGR
jgi:general secretion pathway protein K